MDRKLMPEIKSSLLEKSITEKDTVFGRRHVSSEKAINVWEKKNY